MKAQKNYQGQLRWLLLFMILPASWASLQAQSEAEAAFDLAVHRGDNFDPDNKSEFKRVIPSGSKIEYRTKADPRAPMKYGTLEAYADRKVKLSGKWVELDSLSEIKYRAKRKKTAGLAVAGVGISVAGVVGCIVILILNPFGTLFVLTLGLIMPFFFLLFLASVFLLFFALFGGSRILMSNQRFNYTRLPKGWKKRLRRERKMGMRERRIRLREN